MERRRLTYAMLEKATGLSSQTITRARGTRIRELSLDKLHAIAEALGVSIKDLFDETVPPEMPGRAPCAPAGSKVGGEGETDFSVAGTPPKG